MTLYEECIEALKNNYEILAEDERSKILNDFENKFKLTSWGRINWNEISQKVQVNSATEIKSKLINNTSKNNINVYIIWDEVNLPIVKSDLSTVIRVIDDVTAVSFDTWLVSLDDGVIIEFYHDGEITIGIK